MGMIFYRITLRTPPEFVFACRVDIDNYKNRFPYREDLLELSVCEAGEMIYRYDSGETEIVYPGMMVPITKDLVCTTGMTKPGRQKHITVGAVAEYDLMRYDTNTADAEAIRRDMDAGHTFLIPYHWDLGERYDGVVRLLEKIVQNAFARQGGKRLCAVADWYRLCAELSEMVLEKLDDTQQKISPYGIRYAEQAQAYIHENYREPLKVSQIAEKLGISCGYLHAVFRNVFRCGVTEYINGYRVQLAVQFIRGRGISLKEAAALVGVEDTAYMSRIFRKVTGMSYREFLVESGLKKEMPKGRK